MNISVKYETYNGELTKKISWKDTERKKITVQHYLDGIYVAGDYREYEYNSKIIKNISDWIDRMDDEVKISCCDDSGRSRDYRTVLIF